MPQVVVENLYILQNGDGTVDTMVCKDTRMVDWIASVKGYNDRPRGGIMDLVQIPVTTTLDLDSTALKFGYRSPN